MFNSLKFKVVLFGFIFTFFSSFGQSFFLDYLIPVLEKLCPLRMDIWLNLCFSNFV